MSSLAWPNRPASSGLLSVLLAAACFLPAAGRAAEVRFEAADAAITIDGMIDRGDDAKFQALLDNRPTKLVIRSIGGAQLPSMAIAREVHARAMTVVVDGYCASACAQIIFAAAGERRIRPPAFLVFHDGNLAVLHAMRDALIREAAALPAPADAASSAEDTSAIDPSAATRRAGLARAVAEFDAIDAMETGFTAEMKLDPTVVAFYHRLTAVRDVHVTLGPDEQQPARVEIGRRGICDGWIPDQDSLAKLGLSLRNAYDVPPIEALAATSRISPGRLYLGPPIPLDDPRFETLCKPP